MITDLYKEGTAKDMKKWAYEIHSSFLVPNAVHSSRALSLANELAISNLKPHSL